MRREAAPERALSRNPDTRRGVESCRYSLEKNEARNNRAAGGASIVEILRQNSAAESARIER
jgi:hypothetical protein